MSPRARVTAISGRCEEANACILQVCAAFSPPDHPSESELDASTLSSPGRASSAAGVRTVCEELLAGFIDRSAAAVAPALFAVVAGRPPRRGVCALDAGLGAGASCGGARSGCGSDCCGPVCGLIGARVRLYPHGQTNGADVFAS